MLLIKKKEKEILPVELKIKNNENKEIKTILVNTVKEVEISKITKVVKWQQSNLRLGTHTTKDVSEINYSTKKLRKQKGGGCARARNKGAVHFRGGATIFGPDGRKYDYKINKKEKTLGLQHALSFKIKEQKFLVIENLNFDSGTVKAFLQFKKIFDIKTNSILFIDNEKNNFILKAINNLHESNFLPVMGINVLSVIKNDILICTEGALKVLNERGVL
jgi:large subunit ribosomal protein L4